MNDEKTSQCDRDRIEILPIFGMIEGHYLAEGGVKTTRYEDVLPRLARLEEEKCRGLLVLLNTMGGDVESGLAIAEAIAGVSFPTATLVMGGGHSIGVPLAVSAVRSFIAPSATMTLHPVRFSGTLIGAPQSWRYLSGMQKRVIAFISSHSGVRAEDLQSLMLQNDDMANDMGTILSGQEAVKLGLIDAVGSIGDALSWLLSVTKV